MSILKTLMKIMNNVSNHMPGFQLAPTSSSCPLRHDVSACCLLLLPLPLLAPCDVMFLPAACCCLLPAPDVQKLHTSR